MRALFDIFSSILNNTKKLDIIKLPTQGYFYPLDFEIRIKKAKIEDIIEYEHNFKPGDVLEIIEIIKTFVKKNIEFSKQYKFEDIKSIDIIFIFLELVKYTNNKPIKINYFDSSQRKNSDVDFTYKLFNYFNFKVFEKFYLSNERVFEIDGYKFSMPSIGVENSVTRFLLNKVNDDNASIYNNKSYDFLFFLGDKNELSDSEIDNLITIFNDDIDDDEKSKVKNVILNFKNLIGYSIKVDNQIIDLKSNLDLENIWKD